MKVRAYFGSLVANFLHRSDTEEELRSHIQLRADDLERSGLSRSEAERRASIEFGGKARFQEECRDALGGVFFDTVVQDLRFAARVLRKSPSFTFAAVVTLAMAIGANAVVFGVLNALLLRPLNVPRAQSLYSIERGSYKAVNHSYADYLDLRDRNRSFDSIAAYNLAPVGLATGKDAFGSWTMEVTGNYFDVLGIRPYLGRFFHAADEHGPNSAPYIVLTYAYWHAHFQDDRSIAGRVVQVNKHPFTILGVAPPEFRGTLLFASPDFWVPLVDQEQVEGSYVLDARSNRDLLMVLGHVKAGVTPAQAISDLNSIGSYLEKTYPKDDGQMTFSLARPGLAGDWLGSPVRAFLTGLMLLAALILLAACANLGSLFTARATDQSREIAVRLALGSSRTRVVRQVFSESVLIAMVGGGVGLWGSVLLLHGLSVWRPLPAVPLNIPVYPDVKVYAVALLLSVASGFVFGAVPVRQVLRTDAYQVIKSGTAGGVGRRITVRDVLLVVQIAICAVLVTSSMVAVRGLVRSLHSNFGFVPRNATLLETALSMGGYKGDSLAAMQKRVVDAIKIIRGVKFVGSVDRPQLYYGANGAIVFSDKAADLRPSNAASDVTVYNVSPDFFNAAGTRLLLGRDFTWHDDKNAPRVAVINGEFARKIFGSETNAIGSYFKRQDGARTQVVGVVEDGKYATLTEGPQAAMFLPAMQSAVSEMSVVIRSERNPQQLTAAIRSAMRNLDAALPFEIKPWERELDGALFASRIATISLGVLGAMGAMLSITGIFGMAAYSVSKRLRDLGIRMALGARRKEILHAALGRAFRLLAFGSAAGLALGILASRVIALIVYQATPRDPFVLACVVLAMALLGLLATWIPAQRALSLDPSILLRDQ